MSRLSVVLGLVCLFILPHPADAQNSCDSDIPFGDNSDAGQFVDVDGSRVYYETYGDEGDRPLVLIHGDPHGRLRSDPGRPGAGFRLGARTE